MSLKRGCRFRDLPPEKKQALLIHNSLHCNSQEGKEEPNPQQLNQKNEATEAIKSNSSIEMFEKNPLIVLADSIEAVKSEDTCDLLPSVHNSPEKTSNDKHSDGETKRTYMHISMDNVVHHRITYKRNLHKVC
jgi:hypothetical protein